MKATLFIDGWVVGEIEYEHPKNDLGKTVPLPSPHYKSQLAIVIHDGDNNKWIGGSELDRY